MRICGIVIVLAGMLLAPLVFSNSAIVQSLGGGLDRKAVAKELDENTIKSRWAWPCGQWRCARAPHHGRRQNPADKSQPGLIFVYLGASSAWKEQARQPGCNDREIDDHHHGNEHDYPVGRG